ncbi:MAG: CPBP family intramembrane metalloprotease [Phycisphaerae bacterium]|nr:CPBP family intramembrane metalloprotease [Phycisphaerae bacterium]
MPTQPAPTDPRPRDASLGRTLWLAAEFVALFAVGPLLHYAGVLRPPLLLVIWVIGLAALALLWHDPTFDRRSLWRLGGTGGRVGAMLGRWAVATLGVAGLTAVFLPDRFLWLPMNRPGLWLLVMALYPIVSVLMQGVVYRSFLFHRYRDLFPTPTTMIPAASAAFAFGHVIFHNWLAVALTAVGGVLFALTYHRTRSGLFASMEHVLYGNMLFTVGPGVYLVMALSDR